MRDAALNELDTWMRDLRIIARVALKDRPQLLEQIGVVSKERRRRTNDQRPKHDLPALVVGHWLLIAALS
jgi:hypothetical protein